MSEDRIEKAEVALWKAIEKHSSGGGLGQVGVDEIGAALQEYTEAVEDGEHSSGWSPCAIGQFSCTQPESDKEPGCGCSITQDDGSTVSSPAVVVCDDTSEALCARCVCVVLNAISGRG